MDYQMFINNEFCNSSNGEFLESINPATGKAFAKFPKGTVKDMDKAIQAARLAFDKGDWPKFSWRERAMYLRKIAELIAQEAYNLAQLETQDNGKPLKETTFIDIPMAADVFDYFASIISEAKGEANLLTKENLSYTLYEPVGIVGAIVPWNYPLLLACWKIAAALAAGNTVILKPSQETSLSVLALAKIIKKVDLPKGVFNVVTGLGSEIGTNLVEDKRVDMISFTGSNSVGKEIMKLASVNVKKLLLELGGKSADIVFSDSNLEEAVNAAILSNFMNQGQMCVAMSRVLVEEKIYEPFIKLLVERTKKIKIGDGLDPSTQMGPLISQKQRKHVLDCINKGLSEKAKLLCGGKIPDDPSLKDGFYLEPTIFTELNYNSSLFNEEIFGPVMSVIKFSDEASAIEIANNSTQGLACSIWTNDLKKAHRISCEIKVGTVWVNNFGGFYAEMPFGGYKESGFGKELGKTGLLNYMQLKHININLEKKPLITTWYSF